MGALERGGGAAEAHGFDNVTGLDQPQREAGVEDVAGAEGIDRRDGKRRHVAHRVAVAPDDAGGPVGDRQEAVEAVAQRQQRGAEILDRR